MNWRSINQGLLLGLLALAPLGCGAVQGDQEQRAWPAAQLTAAEERLARVLAEQEIFGPRHGIAAGEKVYFTRVQLLPGATAETTGQLARVTHYRYRGNRAILTTVDLEARQVVDVETIDNLPTPLAEAEVALALELARADARLAPLWADYGDELTVEVKPAAPAPGSDPAATHRVAHLLFRVGRDYLNGPRAAVDLADETVIVEETKGGL